MRYIPRFLPICRGTSKRAPRYLLAATYTPHLHARRQGSGNRKMRCSCPGSLRSEWRSKWQGLSSSRRSSLFLYIVNFQQGNQLVEMAVIRPHIRISSPIQQHDNQGSSQGFPTAYESHVSRQAWGKREPLPVCINQYVPLVIMMRPGPRARPRRNSNQARPAPRAAETAAGRFDMCRGVSEGEQPPSHSLVREKQQRLIR